MLSSEQTTFSFFDADYRRDPHAVLARLRTLDPVHHTRFGWILTRHADVMRINRDPRCGRDMRKLREGGLIERVARFQGLTKLYSTLMFRLDAPEHPRIRKLMAYAFTPKAVEQMEQSVTKVARELLARLPAHGEIDLIRDFARPLPVTVICDLLEVPRDDFDRLQRWSDEVAETVESTATDPQLAAAESAWWELRDYLAQLVAERRDPANGLVDHLIAAERAAGALSTDELLANIAFLLIAGHETTVNLIGNGMLALLDHPDQLERLRAQPTLISSAIEECLRYESPATTNARVALEDIEVGGKLIARGELIHCMLGAANRDPEVFEDPNRFDIARTPNPHQSFGGGPHYCIGAPLARLEGRIAIAGLVDHYSSLALDRARVRWRARINLRGLSELGVRVQH